MTSGRRSGRGGTSSWAPAGPRRPRTSRSGRPRPRRCGSACSTSDGARDPPPAHRAHPRRLARRHPRRPGRPALRPARRGSVGSRPRSAVQPREAAARPLRACGHRHRHLRPGGAGARRRRPARRQHPRLGAGHAALRRHARHLRLGGRHPAAHPLARHGDLRAARQGLHQAAQRDPRGAPRHLRRPRPPHRDPLPQGPRRDRGRAVARAALHHRARRRRPRAGQLLGLQHDRVPGAGGDVLLRRRARPADHRVQADGQELPRRRHRGDPRRGLQPHRRGRARRAVVLLPRARRRRLLQAGRHRGRRLLGRHRLRQHRRRHQPRRAPPHHGLAALLGHRDARRRVPLRPRLRPGPHRPRRRHARRVPHHHQPGPGAAAREADRRAVGRLDGRLPGRLVPAAVGGVERPLPRHAARLLARAGVGARHGVTAGGVGRPVRRRRALAVHLGQLRHRPRRLHPARPGVLRPASTTRPTARATATAPTTTGRGTTASRARPTTPRSWPCGTGRRRT